MGKKAEDILGEGHLEPSGIRNKEDEQQKLASAIVKTVQQIEQSSMPAAEQDQLWHAIKAKTLPKIEMQRRLKISLRFTATTIAATICLALGCFFWMKKDNQTSIEKIAKNNKHYFSSSKQVQLLDADKVKHELATDTFIDYVNFAKVNAFHSKNDPKQKNVKYNSIGVPYGRRMEVLLSDSTRIWLNAGSILTFPEHFATNKREVYLEGEGYFEVYRNSKAPFTVKTDKMAVCVLGTTFNVSAYADDPYNTATLLTGQIAVEGSGKETFKRQVLQPGMSISINRGKGNISVEKAVGEESISWTRRRLLLRKTPLSEIVKKLERIYNTELIDQSDIAASETFSGSLDLTRPLLNVLQNVYDRNSYFITQVERRIYIQRK